MDHADIISIAGLEFYGYHGVSDAEQAVGHRYQVDVRLMVDTRAASESDDVADTVDYSAVAASLVQIGIIERFRLLEALAAHMAQAIIQRFPRVIGVNLRIQKLLPPINAVMASVGVEITRFRAEYEVNSSIPDVV